MKLNFIIVLVFCRIVLWGQFAPPADQSGSTAIHKDSNVFVAWANDIILERGYVDISNKSLGYVDYGVDSNALGRADGVPVSLGDSGVAILSFDPPVVNEAGWDFAVFENGFSDEFLELAFVEVSSDGENYFRFPSISLTDTSAQVETFGTLDARKIHNFAGKYRVNFGTPFDLDSLPDDDLLDKNNVRYIKIVDVVGSIDDRFASFDFYGNKVNDPFPTPFGSGGFDLDAIGVIHQKAVSKSKDFYKADITIYPNPVFRYLNIISGGEKVEKVEIFNISGKKVLSFKNYGGTVYDLSILKSGIYFVKISIKNNNDIVKKIIKR